MDFIGVPRLRVLEVSSQLRIPDAKQNFRSSSQGTVSTDAEQMDGHIDLGAEAVDRLSDHQAR